MYASPITLLSTNSRLHFFVFPPQVYKGNGDYMFSTGYGREFQQDVGDTYDFTMGALSINHTHIHVQTNCGRSLDCMLACMDYGEKTVFVVGR